MKRLLQEKDGGIVFSLSTILPVFVTLVFAIAIAGLESPTEEIWYLYAQYLLTQVSFAIVLVAYFAKTKISLRDAGVRGCRPQYFLIALILQIGIFFGLSDLNLIFIEKLGDWFGYEPTVAALPPTEGWWLVLTLFVVAVLPADSSTASFSRSFIRIPRRRSISLSAAASLRSSPVGAAAFCPPSSCIF